MPFSIINKQPLPLGNYSLGQNLQLSAGTLNAITRRPQIITSRNAVITSSRQGTLGGRTDVRNESRLKMYVGNQAVSQVQFGVGCFQLTAAGEIPFANPFLQEFAMELASPATYQECAFGPSFGPTALPPGLPYLLTTPVGLDIAAGGTFFLRQAASTTSSVYYLPLAVNTVLASTDNDYLSNASTSQIPGTGSLSAPSGYGIQQPALPLLTLGIPAAPMPAVIYCGDSIGAGTGDVSGISTYASLGYIQRGLESAGGATGVPVPWQAQSMPTLDFLHFTKAYSQACRSMWQYATHLVIQLGTNDIANDGASLATLQGYVTEMCTAAKRTIGPYGKPLQTAVVKLIPRTNSTDSWATAANQTPLGGFGVGGIRDQYNAWAAGLVGGGLVDKVIDPNVYIEDPNNHGCWITNGTANYPTSDGTHPTTAVHVLAAQAVNAWASAITP